jgi:predicted ATP-binding protein involved in virulence
MDPASSYKHFREWFKWAWQSHANMLAREKATDVERKVAQDRVRVVQGVIDVFLSETTGWNTLEFSVDDQNSLILNHDQAGKMIVDTMSDGIRSMLSMVGDIAYRCVKLNPHLGSQAALESPGVVLIDEIDMHLHPRWQQSVLTQLKKAFPNIQFIVTTHSPQVLTTVPPEAIRGLKTLNGKLIIRDKYEFSEGAEAQIVLEDILGVSARPENLEIVKILNRYLDLITLDEGKSEEALSLRQHLDEWSNGHEAALIKADMDIRMREFRKINRP